jgi:putative peptidoglycan lipid II flippase
LSVPFVIAFLVVPDQIMRAMFARGAFTKGDAAAAGATLAAYAVGLIPFVLIRSAVATFYARRDTATPVKAALIGVAVNVALKIALVGSLAQVGLAFATAVGAWINLSLVIAFAVRAGYLQLDAVLMRSMAKFVAAGAVLGVALWLAAHLSASYLAALTTLHDETVFLALIVVGALVYAGAILMLFGGSWLRSLVRGRGV